MTAVKYDFIEDTENVRQRLPKHYVVDAATGCWIWTGCKRFGYAILSVEGHAWPAHRASYLALIGSIPDGLNLDHLCCNKACVNPAHLEPVTHLENIRRYFRPRTHCRNGHEYTPENVSFLTEAGHVRRRCLACDRRRDKRPPKRSRKQLCLHCGLAFASVKTHWSWFPKHRPNIGGMFDGGEPA